MSIEDDPKPIKFPDQSEIDALTFAHKDEGRRGRAFLVGRDFKGCQHKRVWVDIEGRKLECRTCGARIDPFDYILTQARNERNVYADVQAMRWEWRRKFEEVKTIKNKTCKHTRAERLKDNSLFCPSCNAILEPPQPLKGMDDAETR